MQGAYGAWINTDGFTIGEQKEIFAGMRIFEIAKQAGTVRHYVWSSLDYALKVCISSPARGTSRSLTSPALWPREPHPNFSSEVMIPSIGVNTTTVRTIFAFWLPC